MSVALIALSVFLEERPSYGASQWKWQPIPDLFRNDGPVCESFPKKDTETFEYNHTNWFEGSCTRTIIYLPYDSSRFQISLTDKVEIFEISTAQRHSVTINFTGASGFSDHDYWESLNSCPKCHNFVPQLIFRNLGSSRLAFSDGATLHILVTIESIIVHFVLDLPFENAYRLLRSIRIETRHSREGYEQCNMKNVTTTSENK